MLLSSKSPTSILELSSRFTTRFGLRKVSIPPSFDIVKRSFFEDTS
jgi:hypothetical protein